MKLHVYGLLAIFFYGSLMSNSICEKDAICNGFKQFLGEIDCYKSEQLIGGLSKNKQYLYSVNKNKYVVRVLGEILSKRCSEVAIHSLAANKGIAPKIHYYDDNYSFMIMDFIEGHTLFLEQANQYEVLDLIAQQVHAITQFDTDSFIHTDGWNLYAQINNDYNKISNQQLPILNAMIDQTFKAMEAIHQSIEDEQRPLVPCHNDLNYRNIFFTGKDIIFIDWEMAGINYDFYDLAYYSVFSCLKESDDYYLLTQYLQRIPSLADYDYFKRIKLMIRCCNAFYILAFLENIPQFILLESIKTFEFYAHIFSQDATVMSPEFLYAIAISQLQLFDEEYKNLKI